MKPEPPVTSAMSPRISIRSSRLNPNKTYLKFSPFNLLPLKRRVIAMFLPFQGGGEEGDGVSAGIPP